MYSSESQAHLPKVTASAPNTRLMAFSLRMESYGDSGDSHLLALSLVENVFLNLRPHNSQGKNMRNYTCIGTISAPSSLIKSAVRTWMHP